MKPVAFEYCRADTLEEVYELLDEFGSDASIISGGLSLGAMLNMRLVRPTALVDINGVADLSQIASDSGSVITGALVRQAAAMAAPDLISAVPLLAHALPYVGHYQTQSRGTLGGSVAHADPSAEIPLSLVTLGGSVLLASKEGRRQVPARDFFQGILTTDRQVDEIVIGLNWPRSKPGAGFGFEELAQRHGDFAIVAVAAQAVIRDGKIADLSFGIGGVEERPFVVESSGFAGQPATPRNAARIAELAAEAVDPMSDLQANPDYRRQLVRVLGARVLEKAFNDAQQTEIAF